eukprot:GAHX01002602.1.p1 GENE.GAHX01002602.1~~GAHX01002602.1.p1  ORF type:complete len:618 (-),score=135.89 GAHX01002602.1:21-1874(-)
MRNKKSRVTHSKFPRTHLVAPTSNGAIKDKISQFPLYFNFLSFDTDQQDQNQPENTDLYFQLILTPLTNVDSHNKIDTNNHIETDNVKRLILYIERNKFVQEAPLLCNLQEGELLCLVWDARIIDLQKLQSILNTTDNTKVLEGNYVPFVILQPCIRLGVTTLSSSFYCKRKTILSIIAPSFSSNVNTIIGTHLHELIQESLLLKDLEINNLKDKSKELIFRDCLEINRVGQSVNYISEKVSFYFPYIMSFHENLIKKNTFLNSEDIDNKIEIFNIEEPINSIVYGLSGFIDIVIKVQDKLHIIELKTMFNKKPLSLTSVNSAYISQVTLYIAMLNEKYNLDLSSAYIYNILNPTYDYLEVKHDPNILRNIINARNELIFYLNPNNAIPQAVSDPEERKRKCNDIAYNKKCAVLNYADSDNYVDIEEFENIFYWDETHLQFINKEFKYCKEEIYKVLKSNNKVITENVCTFKISKFEIKNNKLTIYIHLKGCKEASVKMIEEYKGERFLCLSEMNTKNKNDIKFMLIKRLKMTELKTNGLEKEKEKTYVLKKDIEDIFEEKYIKRILKGYHVKSYFISKERFKSQFNYKLNAVIDLFIKGNLENDKFSTLLISKLNL